MVQVGLPFPLVFEVIRNVLEPAHSFIQFPVVDLVVPVIEARFSLLLKPFQMYAGVLHLLNGLVPNVYQCFSLVNEPGNRSFLAFFLPCAPVAEGVVAAFRGPERVGTAAFRSALVPLPDPSRTALLMQLPFCARRSWTSCCSSSLVAACLPSALGPPRFFLPCVVGVAAAFRVPERVVTAAFRPSALLPRFA